MATSNKTNTVAEKVTIRISGRAKVFLQEMKDRGFDEVTVFSLALGLFKEAVETGQVAKVDNSKPIATSESGISSPKLEYYYFKDKE